MGLGVWFREEIERVLWATKEAMEATVRATGDKESDYLRGYRDGYEAAIEALANAFGIRIQRRWP